LLLRPHGSVRYGARLACEKVIGHHLIPVIEPARGAAGDAALPAVVDR